MAASQAQRTVELNNSLVGERDWRASEMSYSAEIAQALCDQLRKFSTLNSHQLAGHVSNLDFWMAEVDHCLGVLDGYRSRFEQMKNGQSKHAAEHQTIEFDLHDRYGGRSVTPPRSVPDGELKDVRRKLCDAAYHFLVRCFKEQQLDEKTLRVTCDRLGISVATSDLRA